MLIGSWVIGRYRVLWPTFHFEVGVSSSFVDLIFVFVDRVIPTESAALIFILVLQ